MSSLLKGKNILVTGGTGSIGQSIVERSLKDGAKSIKVFSNDEFGLYEMELEFKSKKLEFIIGDVTNAESINTAVKNVDIIFHTAALKHVDRCEYHPFEAITTNVIGTNHVIKAATQEHVKRMINISTDKAVNPVGVLGATKLLTEKLLAAEALHSKTNTIFTSVRFGNVLHTRGSIIPRIEKQIKMGGPITLTDTKMRRFFISKIDAVSLILDAIKMSKGGETFVLKMPLIRLQDLFEVMKEFLAPKYGFKPEKILTKIIGMRPGEKLTEYLLTDFEMNHVLETKNLFIMPFMFSPLNIRKYPNARKPKNVKEYFNKQKPVSKKEILKMLKEVY